MAALFSVGWEREYRSEGGDGAEVFLRGRATQRAKKQTASVPQYPDREKNKRTGGGDLDGGEKAGTQKYLSDTEGHRKKSGRGRMPNTPAKKRIGD